MNGICTLTKTGQPISSLSFHHITTQREGNYLQPGWHPHKSLHWFPDLRILASRLWEMIVYCFSHKVCGTLLQQPGLNKLWLQKKPRIVVSNCFLHLQPTLPIYRADIKQHPSSITPYIYWNKSNHLIKSEWVAWWRPNTFPVEPISLKCDIK
jgi:hypothetical protein